jgi:hypothetical protein
VASTDGHGPRRRPWTARRHIARHASRRVMARIRRERSPSRRYGSICTSRSKQAMHLPVHINGNSVSEGMVTFTHHFRDGRGGPSHHAGSASSCVGSALADRAGSCRAGTGRPASSREIPDAQTEATSPMQSRVKSRGLRPRSPCSGYDDDEPANDVDPEQGGLPEHGPVRFRTTVLAGSTSLAARRKLMTASPGMNATGHPRLSIRGGRCALPDESRPVVAGLQPLDRRALFEGASGPSPAPGRVEPPAEGGTPGPCDETGRPARERRPPGSGGRSWRTSRGCGR